MIKNAIITGLGISIVHVIWMFLVVQTGLIQRVDLTLLPVLIPALLMGSGMYIGVRYIRGANYEGRMNYAQSFYTSVTITFSMALFIFLLLSLLESISILIPDLIENMKHTTRLNMELEKLPENKIQDFIKLLDQPYLIAKNSIVQSLFYGIILSTIVALFVRNKDTFTSHLTEEEKK
ncbi:MAG: DUF4199 domain-containing protein [Cytophagaceae bacterium]|jgi:hypothetical protein|nr:DUF4199 domain-containing protein [Cytophagaceae bacterium]